MADTQIAIGLQRRYIRKFSIGRRQIKPTYRGVLAKPLNDFKSVLFHRSAANSRIDLSSRENSKHATDGSTRNYRHHPANGKISIYRSFSKNDSIRRLLHVWYKTTSAHVSRDFHELPVTIVTIKYHLADVTRNYYYYFHYAFSTEFKF